MDWSNPYEADWHLTVFGGLPLRITFNAIMENGDPLAATIVCPRPMRNALLGLQLIHSLEIDLYDWNPESPQILISGGYKFTDVYYPYNPAKMMRNSQKIEYFSNGRFSI